MTPVELGHQNTGGSSTTRVITVATAPGATDPVTVAAVSSQSNATAVTDSRGNTYASLWSLSNNFGMVVFITAQDVAPLQVGDTITVTYGGTSVASAVTVAHSWPGYTATTDGTSSHTSGTTATTARDAGSVTTTNATDVIVGYHVLSGVESSFTPAAGWSDPSPAFYTFSTKCSVECEYQEVTSTGTYNPTGTGGTSGRTAGVVVALEKAAGGSPQTVNPTGLGSSAAFGSAAASSKITETPAGLGSSAAFGTPAVQTKITVAAAGLGSSGAFGTPTALPGGVTATVAGLGSSGSFGTATASRTSGPQTVNPTGLGSSGAFGTPTAKGRITVAVAALGSAASFGSATGLPGSVTVHVTGLGSSAAFGAAGLPGAVRRPRGSLRVAGDLIIAV